MRYKINLYRVNKPDYSDYEEKTIEVEEPDFDPHRFHNKYAGDRWYIDGISYYHNDKLEHFYPIGG